MTEQNTENTKLGVVTRFAPSPTGLMHVGGVRTALYAYLYAKKMGGKFILRIEDTDKVREVPGAIEQIKESLTWLLGDENNGVPWDAIYTQSERLDIYNLYAEKLVHLGLAYNDPYTEEEIAVFRKSAEESKKPFLYRNHRPENLSTVWDKTKPIRLKITNIERTDWTDAVRGNLSAGAEALDDLIIIKSDGYPTYPFCHIVDDIETGVTHVMRGEEFIPSTPKFIALYKSLQIVFPEKNIEVPVFVTLPPILGETGTKKLSKRDGARDVLDYKQEGYLPDALVNFLAFQGWNPGGEKEIYSMDELVEAFTLERIQKSGARWNPDKLDWYNKEYIKLLSEKVLLQNVLGHLPEEIKSLADYSEEKVVKSLGIISERLTNFGELRSQSKGLSYIFSEPKYETSILFWKDEKDSKKITKSLRAILTVLPDSNFSSVEDVKNTVMPVADSIGRGAVLWPLRVALSGQAKSPDPFTLLSLFGKEESKNRIEIAIQKLSKYE